MDVAYERIRHPIRIERLGVLDKYRDSGHFETDILEELGDVRVKHVKLRSIAKVGDDNSDIPFPSQHSEALSKNDREGFEE